MGCFDYQCECGGQTCKHVGEQLNRSTVIIEVPLSDGTFVHLKGCYEEYGYIVVKLHIAADGGYVEYKFYLEQFEEFFEDWFDGESEDDLRTSLLATKVWTQSEDICEDENENTLKHCFDNVNAIPIELTQDIVEKCIQANVNVNNIRKKRIEKLKAKIEFMQKELGRINKP